MILCTTLVLQGKVWEYCSDSLAVSATTIDAAAPSTCGASRVERVHFSFGNQTRTLTRFFCLPHAWFGVVQVRNAPYRGSKSSKLLNMVKEMIGGCCVCSDERGWDENPLVYCDGHGCNVAVHQGKYNLPLEDSLQDLNLFWWFMAVHLLFISMLWHRASS